MKKHIKSILKGLFYLIGGAVCGCGILAVAMLAIILIAFIISWLSSFKIISFIVSNGMLLLSVVVSLLIGVAMFYEFVEWVKNKINKKCN